MSVKRQPWETFRETHLLWFVNRLLHLFGWAICFEVDEEGAVKEVYPARVTFRGFAEPDETEGFHGLTHYLHNNSSALLRDLESNGGT